MRVLVVDDDFSMASSLRIALSQAGFDARAATGGTEALMLLRAESFDWLVTDAQMRPMNGYRLAGQARLLQPGIRAVMISGVCDEDERSEALFEKVFTKPLDADELAVYLRTAPRPA